METSVVTSRRTDHRDPYNAVMPSYSNCGHEVAEGVAFCPQCGAAQGGATGAAYVASREYAGFGTRLVGHIIDAIIIGVAGGVLGAVERNIYGISILGNVVGLAYIWYFVAQGQTLGQNTMGIRIVDAAGNPPGLAWATGRCSICGTSSATAAAMSSPQPAPSESQIPRCGAGASSSSRRAPPAWSCGCTTSCQPAWAA
ncbi:MAG: RDD family protein [Dehalococcoidia bacterium]|nr:RDD family protein [Dehalococcoidia bacterium]